MFRSYSMLLDSAQSSQALKLPPSPRRTGIGIALGSGAARGWAHIGVLKRLAKAGFSPDIVAGTSIGAVVGGCWAAGKLEALEEFALSLSRRRMLGLLDISLSGSGLLNGRKLEDLLQTHLAGLTVENLPRTFAAVGTELGTGYEVWLKNGPVVPAIRASAALPGVFVPVRIGHRWLIDGGLVNPIPVSVCRALGAQIIIAINLNGEAFGRHVPHDQERNEALEDFGYFSPDARDPEEDFSTQLPSWADGAPSLMTVMAEAYAITQDRAARSRLAGDPPDVMLAPRLARIGMFEFDRGADAIRAGEEAAERALKDIETTVEFLVR